MFDKSCHLPKVIQSLGYPNKPQKWCIKERKKEITCAEIYLNFNSNHLFFKKRLVPYFQHQSSPSWETEERNQGIYSLYTPNLQLFIQLFPRQETGC